MIVQKCIKQSKPVVITTNVGKYDRQHFGIASRNK